MADNNPAMGVDIDLLPRHMLTSAQKRQCTMRQTRDKNREAIENASVDKKLETAGVGQGKNVHRMNLNPHPSLCSRT